MLRWLIDGLLWDRSFWLLVGIGNVGSEDWAGGSANGDTTGFAGLGVFHDKGAPTLVVHEVVCLVFLVLIQLVGVVGGAVVEPATGVCWMEDNRPEMLRLCSS